MTSGMAEGGFDVLAVGAHRDDCEIMAGGTLIKLTRMGYRVAVLDLTQGELGTRGSSHIREEESRLSAQVMGIHHRENLDLPDGGVEVTSETRLKMIDVIRRLRPGLIFTHYWEHRHPDHVNTSRLVEESSFLAGLKKIETGTPPHRPRNIIYYLPFTFGVQPSFFVDITDYFQDKMNAVKCYRSQFLDIEEDLHLTPHVKGVLEKVDYYNGYFGRAVKVGYAEGFVIKTPILIPDPVKMEPVLFG